MEFERYVGGANPLVDFVHPMPVGSEETDEELHSWQKSEYNRRVMNMKQPIQGSTLNQSAEKAGAQVQLAKPRVGFTSTRLFTVVAALFALLLVYTVYQLYQSNAHLEESLKQVQTQLAVINQRLDDGDARLAELTAQFQVTTERLGLTKSELERTKQMAARLKREQQERVKELTEELKRKAEAEQVAALQRETTSKLSALSGDVSATRQQVAVVNENVSKTREEVTQLKLKLSEYGTLIARNRKELEYLRRRGERDYFEFDIRKGAFHQVSDLRLKLRKTDTKRQRCDIEYIADDRRVRKKKVNVNEPIQVFVKGLKTPYEIVINRVEKNRIIGYVSAPKERGTAPGKPISSDR